jgi:tetratricopeptide (TPR) repeat protein
MPASSPATLDLMRKALLLQRDGKPARARPLYEKILKTEPGNAEAANLLALCFVEQGFPRRAISILAQLVAHPGATSRHLANLVDLVAEQDGAAAALVVADRSLAHIDGDADLLARLAVLRRDAEGALAALADFDRALRAAPGNADLLADYARTLSMAGRQAEAVKVAEFLLQSIPNHRTAILVCVDALIALDRGDEALALLLEQDESLCTIPDAAYRLSRANAFWSNARYEEALSESTAALALGANAPLVHLVHGKTLFRLGRFDEAVAAIETGLALEPENPNLASTLGFVEVRKGNLARGWELLETRFATELPGLIHRSFAQPVWDGTPVADGAVLLWSDQGVGDVFRAATMLEEAAARTPNVIVECGPKNLPILSRNFPALVFRANALDKASGRSPHADFAAQISLGSLPRLLRPTPDSFPDRARVIGPEPERLERFSQLPVFCDGRPVVGLSWRSLRANKRHAHLYIGLESLRPILERDDCVFLSLQYGDTAEELDDFTSRTGIVIHRYDEIDIFDDLENAAALAALTDLYIAPDCTGADIAAVLGVPVWRYSGTTSPILVGDGNAPWYPSTTIYEVPPGAHADVLMPRMAADFDKWRATYPGRAAVIPARLAQK